MIDTLISQIHSEGFLFNNCYQDDEGGWRINLRKPNGSGDFFTDWAEASTFEKALEICRANMQSAVYVTNPEVTHRAADKNLLRREQVNLSALLGLKGPPIKRRRISTHEM